jgi:hypothetical protein
MGSGIFHVLHSMFGRLHIINFPHLAIHVMFIRTLQSILEEGVLYVINAFRYIHMMFCSDTIIS